MMSFSEKFFAIRASQKIDHYPEPYQKISTNVCSILLLSMSSHAMSNFIDRFQISCENIYTLKNYDILNFWKILQELQQKFKTS